MLSAGVQVPVRCAGTDRCISFPAVATAQPAEIAGRRHRVPHAAYGFTEGGPYREQEDGVRGRSRVAGLFGSVVSAVTARARCPVVVVHDPVDEL
ncbi:hypothetical protein Ait01nite_027560 [Actinoplanes italicus]|nr:hypothetical protein Ait01nite_027560 [Actinoplanes italicus]